MGARHGWARVRRVIHAIRRLSHREKLTTVHAVAVMSIVELTVRWIPLPRLSHLMGVPLRLGPDEESPDLAEVDDLDALARRQLDCTARIAAVWPFSDGPCLRRSLTGGHLIRRLKPTLRLGVIDEGNDLGAHAWLEVDGRPLESVAHLQPFQNIPTRGIR